MYSEQLPESANKYLMLGLNLVFLLSQNRVEEFHNDLKLIPNNIVKTNKYIIYSVELEECLTKSSYTEVITI